MRDRLPTIVAVLALPVRGRSSGATVSPSACEAPDPVALRQISWELAPFYCPECGLNYCKEHWRAYVLLDDGFYDCTMGRCPAGHRHMLDD